MLDFYKLFSFYSKNGIIIVLEEVTNESNIT